MSRKPDDKTHSLKPLKWYKSLATGRGRLEAGAFLVEGSRAIDQVISSDPAAIIEIVSAKEPPPVYRKYVNRIVTLSQLNSICSTKTPQGIAAVVRLPLETYSDRLPDFPGDKILVLEDIQDPGNVGTLIRTAAAFGYAGAILTDKCADPFSPKCVQAAAGTVLSLWLRRTSRYLELVKILKNKGHTLVAADLRGDENISVLQGRAKLLLALGNEAGGLSKSLLEIANYRLRIPIIREKTESLNVAACGAICMYLSSHIST
ncbi:MAG: RNA methyltransferase [Dehalococcoidia bacterium]|nr:RNA methyltransferase [Dehalococcoidia bacterium]MDD5493844.1 RNA methyltransferase [Dehalococcoidia bacterium]